MNTAHQRGDHSSVTKALLLMFHIYSGGHHSADQLVSAEDILIRCIKRCEQLHMHRHISEIALLLAECRSRGLLLPSQRLYDSNTTNTIDSHINNSLQCVWSVADIFTQISAAMLGNSQITSQIVSYRGNVFYRKIENISFQLYFFIQNITSFLATVEQSFP